MGHSCCVHLDAARRRDPTGTTTIRRAFEGDAARRFRRLKGLINMALIQNDVLGLMRKTVGDGKQAPIVMLDDVPRPGAFAFSRTGDKVSLFMSWLKEQQDEGILEIVPGTPMEQAAEQSWANVYIQNAYHKGIRDAGAKLRAAGAAVAPSWVESAFTRPIHADRAGLAFTRVFSELTGITQTMDQQISRVLAQGLAEGQNPMQIARNINNRVDKIGITRARVLARTEVIAAHADASLNAYEEAGVHGVEVEAEFATAGDGNVCPECEALDGQTYELSQARGLIPVHPNCRCALIPLVVNGSGITLH